MDTYNYTNFTCILLSKRNQTQKVCLIYIIVNALQKRKTVLTETDQWLPQWQGKGIVYKGA